MERFYLPFLDKPKLTFITEVVPKKTSKCKRKKAREIKKFLTCIRKEKKPDWELSYKRSKYKVYLCHLFLTLLELDFAHFQTRDDAISIY